MNTHGLICDFGRHKGTPYTQIPVSYLKWMVNVEHSRQEIAKSELKRRGTVTPDVDISGHAIDRASLRCRDIWHQTRSKEEGLHAWLVRMTQEAIQKGEQDKNGKYIYNNMKLVIEQDGVWPVLKTILRLK